MIELVGGRRILHVTWDDLTLEQWRYQLDTQVEPHLRASLLPSLELVPAKVRRIMNHGDDA